MFINAQEMQKKHPATFEAPSKRDLDKLKTGDLVKVCHNDERFWTSIVEIDGDNIRATVDNELLCNQSFKYGDTINFKKNNIYAIYS